MIDEKSKERRIIFFLSIWSVLVHWRSMMIWFDWETVRFFIQPRPGRYRIINPLFGNWIDLTDYGITVASETLRPLISWSFQLESIIYGDQVWGYHLLNLTIHIACVILLFYLGKYWKLTLSGRALSALLFAVHPLTTQPLWILGDRAEQFVLLGGLITLLAYHAKSRNWSLFGLFLALYSKETAITIPIWLLISDWLFEKSNNSSRRSILERMKRQGMHWGLTGIYLLHRIWVFQGLGGYRSVQHTRIDHLTDVLAQNIAWIMTIPHPSPWLLTFGIPILFLLLHPRSAPAIRMSILWGIVFILPVHNLCNKWYLYTPTAAASVFLVSTTTHISGIFPRFHRILEGSTLTLAILLSFMSVAELNHQKANADIPMELANRTYDLFPTLEPSTHLFYIMTSHIRLKDLRGEWFDPVHFQVKSQKTPIESIVWDLNATRYLPDFKPIWTRSVEAALRLRYSDITLQASLAETRQSIPIQEPMKVIAYDPAPGTLRGVR